MTQQDIQKVQTNLINMNQFNDYVYTSGAPYIINCFSRLNATDSSDPGNTVVMALLEGSLNAIYSGCGIPGAFASCFMCSLISSWGPAIPPDLNQTFASMYVRYDKSHVQLDRDIAKYHDDPATYWNTTFTWKDLTITLGDLATIDFPPYGDTDFFDLATLCDAALDRAVWQETLKIQCKCSLLSPNTNSETTEISGKTDINQWYSCLINKYPAYYATWAWHSDTGLFDKNYWYVDEYCLNFKNGGATKLQVIPDAAAEYLFIDSTPGVTINKNGMFYRKEVFNDLGIQRVILRTAGVYYPC